MKRCKASRGFSLLVLSAVLLFTPLASLACEYCEPVIVCEGENGGPPCYRGFGCFAVIQPPHPGSYTECNPTPQGCNYGGRPCRWAQENLPEFAPDLKPWTKIASEPVSLCSMRVAPSPWS